MVLNLPPDDWKKLTHIQRRKLINKESKKRKRTARAILREQEEVEEELALQINSKREQANKEAERQLQHEAWIQRERVAQEEFRKKRDEQEKKLREREERERLIREEWEALEKREKEAEERREKAKMDKEALLQQALSTIDNVMEAESGLELWRNPGDTPAHVVTTALAPPSSAPTTSANFREPKPIYGTEKDTVNCPFYIKVGACRFGDRCSRRHPIPSSSSTLLIRGMFSDMSLAGQLPLDEQDQDLSLEVDDQEVYQHYVEFYNDVFPEFEKAGKIQQFKVSCNHEAHLRGNVYVQYSSEEECGKALQSFNGRWYAGRQLSCEYCPVLKWRLAVCGMYDQNRCPKGKHCNFLHIFKNPGEKSPPRPRSRSRERWNRHQRRGSSRDRDYRSRYRDRRGRSRSWSPIRRRHRDRDSYSSDSSPDRHSRSLKRRHSHRSRERSYSPDRRRSRERSYSPDRRSRRRDRSYSPDGHSHRGRKDRSHSPNRHSHSKGRREKSYSPDRSRSSGHHKKKRRHSSSEEDEDTDKHRKHKKHHKHKHRHHKHRRSKRESTSSGDEAEAKNNNTSEEESDEDDAWCR